MSPDDHPDDHPNYHSNYHPDDYLITPSNHPQVLLLVFLKLHGERILAMPSLRACVDRLKAVQQSSWEELQVKSRSLAFLSSTFLALLFFAPLFLSSSR